MLPAAALLRELLRCMRLTAACGLCSFLGYEDLDVVNPQSSSAEKVDQVDADDVRINARRSLAASALAASALHALVFDSIPQCQQLAQT